MDGLSLKDGNYTLIEGKAWLTVKGFAVRVSATDEGVAVDIYKDGGEDADSIACCYAFDSEANEES